MHGWLHGWAAFETTFGGRRGYYSAEGVQHAEKSEAW